MRSSCMAAAIAATRTPASVIEDIRAPAYLESTDSATRPRAPSGLFAQQVAFGRCGRTSPLVHRPRRSWRAPRDTAIAPRRSEPSQRERSWRAPAARLLRRKRKRATGHEAVLPPTKRHRDRTRSVGQPLGVDWLPVAAPVATAASIAPDCDAHRATPVDSASPLQ